MMKRALLTVLALICLSLAATPATAHPLAPALLELEQTGAMSYNVLWRMSALQRNRQAPRPVLPDSCLALGPAEVTAGNGAAVTSRWRVDCAPGGLAGETFRITGLDSSDINVILRLRDRNGGLMETLLDASRPDFVVPEARQGGSILQRYLALGIEHLLLGPDHLLFVLGLLLLVSGLRRLILTLTAFTLGHSVTLSLAALDMISVNPALMELGIAVSLVVLARELLRKRPSLLGRRPGSMAFAFGLIHGLGFAAALNGIGLPQDGIVVALFAFNAGIEIGQVAVVILAVALATLLGRLPGRLSSKPWSAQTAWMSLAPAYFIGTMAALWCFDRMGALGDILRQVV